MCFSPQRRAIFRHRHFKKCAGTVIFTWKCASRHSGVQFLISPLTTWLRTRRFNKPTFRPTGHTNHWKNTAFRDFSNIWRGWIFFLLTFALLHLLCSDFTSSHLLFICFSTLHIVGSLLLKLPSITITSSTAQGGGGSFKNRNYRRDWLLWVTDGRAKTLMDRTVQLCNWLTD